MTHDPHQPGPGEAYPAAPVGIAPDVYGAEMVVPTSRLAVASLVVGIIAVLACFIPVIPGAIAAVMGFIAIQRTGPMKLAGRGLAVTGLVLGCCAVFISILSLSIWLPALSQGFEGKNRTRCSAHMRGLGAAMRGYAISYGGAFPTDLNTLLSEEDVDPATLLCPSADHPAGSRTDVTYVSYIYVGGGLTDSAPASAVLLYESVGNHRRDGAHFVFSDGSVRFIPRTQARAMIQQLEKGINPPDPNAVAPPEPADQP